MSYTVYAKLPNGKVLRYNKKLTTMKQVEKAMAEMRKDLSDLFMTAEVGYRDDNPPKVKKPAPKTAAARPGKITLSTNIRTWYHKAYPTDEAYEDIDPKGTFKDVAIGLIHRNDIYPYCGDDSVIRERVFEALSKSLKIDYQTIYLCWIADRISPSKEQNNALDRLDRAITRANAPKTAASPKTPAVSKPAVSTAKNPGAGKIAGFDRAPYDPKKYVGYLRVARKYYPNAVIVVCYNEADVWGSRAEAKKFYMSGVYACEGAERDRYMNVVCDLEDGKDVALDTWDY